MSIQSTAPSLRLRLIGGMGVVVLLFLSTAGIVLDRAFQASAARAAAEKLDVYLLALVGLAEVDALRIDVPTALLDPRFARPHSGLYGLILDDRSNVRWRSASLSGAGLAAAATALARMPPAAPGATVRAATNSAGVGEVFRSAMTVVFEQSSSHSTRYTFIAALSRSSVVAEVSGFRNTLWAGLGAVGLLLVLAELWLFQVITRPLTRLARAVEAIEQGESSALGTGWPQEVAGVTANLDRFIAQERHLRERYRTLTDDLAHSLKTPLAVLRNGLNESQNTRLSSLLREQVQRMQDVLEERLNRVVVRPVLQHGSVPVRSELASLIEALRRLYPNHRLELVIGGEPRFPGEARDLLEFAGNLTDNACKYGRAHVRLSAAESAGYFLLDVEDDGPGIAPSMRAFVLERGVRADTRAAGQGIGLAVVRDLVEAYQGSIQIEQSNDLGGARVTLRLPLHAALAQPK